MKKRTLIDSLFIGGSFSHLH